MTQIEACHSPRSIYLVYEVKWALGCTTMNRAEGGNKIPVELLQILKNYGIKVLSITQQIWKTQQ